MEQYYTKRQLRGLYAPLSEETIAKMLQGVAPEGTSGRWPGWTDETFKKAREDYYKRIQKATGMEEEVPLGNDEEGPLGLQLQEADLRVKTARADALELDNAERRNTLVARKDVEDLIRFMFEMFADKIRNYVREKGDDVYNLLVEEITKEIELYIAEKGIQHVVDDTELKNLEKGFFKPEDCDYILCI